jgi:MoxR-like ATPase
MRLPVYPVNEDIPLEPVGSWPLSVHRFDADTVTALRAAEAAGRPLLLRGVPGTGKSQTARAAAAAAEPERLFLSVVIDGRTEAQDLLWRYDAVGRLSDAHASTGARARASGGGGRSALPYVSPGPLWWAYDWQGAEAQWNKRKQGERPQPPEGWQPEHGTVLLIDEIDKADPDLPNAFLEVLGNQGFSVPFLGDRVVRGGKPPLVVITTNEERDLPDAFLRRCFVHVLKPLADLVLMGRTHLARLGLADRSFDAILQDAAKRIADDQARAKELKTYAPGLAEYLDLVIAVARQAASEADQLALLERTAPFVLDKAAPLDR